MDHLFQGSALNAVDAKGRVSLPAFLRQVVERRGDARAIVLAKHALLPCLEAYDPGHAATKHAKMERRAEKNETAQHLTGVRGELNIETASGDLDVETFGGRLKATAVSGDVSVTGHLQEGEAWVYSTSGDVEVSELAGRVEATAVSGDVTIADHSGGTTFSAADLRDPRVNVRYGCYYLRLLLDRYDGSLVCALAAYNAGPGTVERYGGKVPYRETAAYVERVLKYAGELV